MMKILLDTPIETASDRQFCLVMAGVFSLISVLGLWKNSHSLASWGYGCTAMCFIIIAFSRPKLASPLNAIWTKFGLLLHRIANPLIMAALYYGLFMPMGITARLFGWDPLKKNFEANTSSYWIKRVPQPDSSLKNQF